MSDDDSNAVKCEPLATFATPMCADSVEWCPIPAYSSVLAGGSYQLEEATKERAERRIGQIQLYDLKQNHDRGVALVKNHCIDVDAVLDMKWCPRLVDGKPLLGVADAVGSLVLYSLQEDGTSFTKMSQFRIDDAGVLALSLSWDESNQTDRLAVSYSNGDLRLFTFDAETCELHVREHWHAHELEAWIVLVDRNQHNVVDSGADDGLFKCWDVRESTSKATVVNRSHDCGVCSAHCHPTNEHLIATGSYDDRVRIWDTRFIKPRGGALSDTKVDGGVWRLKWRPDDGEQLLAACMHNGVSVLDCKDVSGKQQQQPIVARFTEHESMAYGADWCQKKFTSDDDGGVGWYIASCSFYDNKLCLWKNTTG